MAFIYPFLYLDSGYTVMYGDLPTRVAVVTWESLSNENTHTVTIFCCRTTGPC